MSFGIYLTGFIIMIVGLGIGAHLLHVPPLRAAIREHADSLTNTARMLTHGVSDKRSAAL